MWLLWIFVLTGVVVSDNYLKDVHLNLVFSLANHFRASFCVIESSSGFQNPNLISSFFYPSRRDLLTAFLIFQDISELLSVRDNVNGARNMIILKANNETLENLKQISQNKSLSPAVWLLFSDTAFDSRVFEDIYIPFDCEFIFIHQEESVFYLTEIYKIDKDTDIETFDFGQWTAEDGLDVVLTHFYSRRNNLRGHQLKAIIKNNPPYVTIEQDLEGVTRFKGYLFEIWSELEYRLNFKTEFPESYFDEDPDDVLMDEDVDFAVARISITPATLDTMEFSQPIHEAKSFMFGHRPGSELDWDSYLKPFSPNTWFVSIVWMILSSLALAVLYRKAWDFNTSEKEAEYYVFSFSESFLTVFRAICMQGSDVTPKSNSCRLFFLSIYLTALVVTSAFSAALFSLLTIPKPRSPFNSLQEVLYNNKFQIGFPADEDFQKLVQDFASTLSASDKMQLLEKFEYSSETKFMTPEEGVSQICEDKFYIFVFDLPNVLYLMQNTTKACQDKILPSGPPLFTEYIGFGFKKGSPYKELINFHLIRMKNEGILKRLLLNYWPPQIPTVQATWVRVTLADISPILYMFASGVILGAIFLQSEKAFLHFRKRRKKKVKLQPVRINEDAFINKQLFMSGFPKTRPQWEIYDQFNTKGYK